MLPDGSEARESRAGGPFLAAVGQAWILQPNMFFYTQKCLCTTAKGSCPLHPFLCFSLTVAEGCPFVCVCLLLWLVRRCGVALGFPAQGDT